MLSELTILLISLLSFFLPTQLGFHLNSVQSTVYGFSIDYLIPTIYLTDIIALSIILLGIRKIKFKFWYVFLYIIFVSLNVFISVYFIPSLYKWLRITELILLGIVIINCKKFDIYKHFVRPLSYSMLIICLLGIMQFLNKGSIGSVFYAFGEREYLVGNPNISPFPYSTFSHPNSFAGFLLVFGIFLLQLKNKFNQKYFWLLSSLVVTNLILTNSLNVYITIVLLVLLNFRTNLSFALLAFDFSERFVIHRLELIKAALTIVKENLLTGVGLNNFIPNLPKVTNTFLNAWELQPVHNIFLLVFSELGIVGFVVFCFFFFLLITNNYSLIAIALTGLSDHYWLTLQQNMLLFTYVLAINYKWKKKI